MTIPGVKILFHTRHTDLDTALNGWLDLMNGQIVIRGISMDSNQHGHALSVLFDRAPGPAYQGRILFNTRHDALERETNQSLQDAGHAEIQFVALGSNQYGHCLCLIGAVRPTA